jgi:cysteine-rich repeat protein
MGDMRDITARLKLSISMLKVHLRLCAGVLALVVTCAVLPAAAQTAPGEEEAPTTTTTTTTSESAAAAWNEYLRAWYVVLHRRWHRIWGGGHEEPPTSLCGDGELAEGEQCDDGNAETGDGCDASCQREDDAATPGDDRPGYVACASADDPALICSPEQRCCRSPENVCDPIERDCQRPDVTVGWGDNCDGPEDCEDGLTCVRAKYGASCQPSNPQQGYPVLCHVDSDCNFLPEHRCAADGICVKL